jgi:hypothetical protein
VAGRPWYVEFLDEDYLRVFEPLLPAERTAAEVNGVVERLGLAPEAVHGGLDGGPLELDSSFLVTVSARAGRGIS